MIVPLICLLMLLWQPAHAGSAPAPPQLAWQPHEGASLPLDLTFSDETGRQVALRRFFGGLPVVLVFSYYRCKGLCPMVLRGVSESASGLQAAIVAVSIDPRDVPADARMRRDELFGHEDPKAVRAEFLTDADGQDAAALARAVGFSYRYDAKLDQYAHLAGIVVINPEGVIQKYLYGVQFNRSQLRAALENKPARESSVMAAQPLLLLCFHFDPRTGQYSLAVMRLLRLAGGVLLAVLAMWMWRYRHREGREA